MNNYPGFPPALVLVAVALLVCLFAFGFEAGRGSVKISEPTITERIDTVTITEARVDTVYKYRERVAYLERIDTVTKMVIDTVAVVVPLSKYVAQKDSLYRVEATGYDVTFDNITVYPKTVTISNTIEVVKPTRWGLGIQAGYGATLQDKTVHLSPYIGVGVSYNLLSW